MKSDNKSIYVIIGRYDYSCTDILCASTSHTSIKYLYDNIDRNLFEKPHLYEEFEIQEFDVDKFYYKYEIPDNKDTDSISI